MARQASAGPLSCFSVYNNATQVVAPMNKTPTVRKSNPDFERADEQKFRVLLGRIDEILSGRAGVNADNELRKILNDDIQAALAKMTDIMNAEDRMIDEVLNGRRNLRFAQSAKNFGEALSEFHQLRAAEASLGVRIKRLVPGLINRRETKLSQSIQADSVKLQGLRTELGRDINLLMALRDATSKHLDELNSQVQLSARLEAYLEKVPRDQGAIYASLLASVTLEVKQQLQNLTEMAVTARASIATIDKVLADANTLIATIDKQLYVTLPRVATSTVMPSLMAGLGAVKQTEILIDSAGQDRGAKTEFSGLERKKFDRLTMDFYKSKDEKTALATLSEILSMQTPEVVPMLKKLFSSRKGALYMIHFLETQKDTIWKVNMSEIHDLIIDRLPVDANQAFVDYAQKHEFDPYQKEKILKHLSNKKLYLVQRLAYLRALLAFPDAQLVSLIPKIIKQNEGASLFAAHVMREIKIHSMEGGTPNSKVSRKVALNEANAIRLRARVKKDFFKDYHVYKQFGGRHAEFGDKFWKFVEENPHPERGEILYSMLHYFLRTKRELFLYDEQKLVLDIERFLVNHPEDIIGFDLQRVRAWLDNTKYETYLPAQAALRLTTRHRIEGLREELDRRILNGAKGVELLMGMRLGQDKFFGPDSMTEIYKNRLAESIARDLASGDQSRDILQLVGWIVNSGLNKDSTFWPVFAEAMRLNKYDYFEVKKFVVSEQISNFYRWLQVPSHWDQYGGYKLIDHGLRMGNVDAARLWLSKRDTPQGQEMQKIQQINLTGYAEKILKEHEALEE